MTTSNLYAAAAAVLAVETFWLLPALDARALAYKREELVLFPFTRKMVLNGKPPVAAFGSVENPIRALSNEHEEEGERFKKMAALSHDYTVPADGCQTYRLTFRQLQEVQLMLHFHIHLENNLLFPQALQMAENNRS